MVGEPGGQHGGADMKPSNAVDPIDNKRKTKTVKMKHNQKELTASTKKLTACPVFIYSMFTCGPTTIRKKILTGAAIQFI